MRALAFGEVLFDVFGDNAKLGGAPLNVASHLKALGVDSQIVSAVGSDDLGRRARSEILGHDVDDTYLKTSSYATGRADVTLHDGSATYTFNDPSAWDDITLTQPAPSSVDVLYWGSLVQRHETSRNTLLALLSRTKAAIRFFDVNIRQHFYSRTVIEGGLEQADVLKMNDEEVPLVTSLVSLQSVEDLLKRYPLRMVLVTLGSRGSALYLKDGTVLHQGTGKVDVVDTVGAGDSLSAGFLASLLKGKSPQTALEVGTMLASYVCTQRGAIPSYSDELKQKLSAYGF